MQKKEPGLEVLALLSEALASLEEDEREALVRLICRVAQNADDLNRALDYVLACVDLIGELKPIIKEYYAELNSLLSLAEDIDFSEILEQIKAFLDSDGYQSSR